MVDADNVDFEALIEIIEGGTPKFEPDEQNVIIAWIEKLVNSGNSEAELYNRNNYAEALAKNVTEKRRLSYPFKEMPPDGPLPRYKRETSEGSPTPKSEKPGGTSSSQVEKAEEPLDENEEEEARQEYGRPGSMTKKFSYKIKKMPCPGNQTGAIPKPKKSKSYRPKIYDTNTNEFEDAEEMARVIANSKGQSFAEFVVAISRHTVDYGLGLRSAMKAETASFKEYVDHVLSQRLKDLTEVLDEEQNAELAKIKKDTDKWLIELAHCKKLIKEVIPDFDLDMYRKDNKYLKKVFNIDMLGKPTEDSFKQWKEESCHRLKWYTEMICKMTRCNEQITQEITNIKSQALELEAREAIKQQNHMQYINCEVNEYQRLKLERDRLHKENADLLSQLQEFGD